MAAGSSGVPPVTVVMPPRRSCTTTELFTNGESAGREPSGFTVPRNVSEKNHPVFPFPSGREYVLSPPVHAPPVFP